MKEATEISPMDNFKVSLHGAKINDVNYALLRVDNEQIAIPEIHIPEFKKYLIDFIVSKLPKNG